MSIRMVSGQFCLSFNTVSISGEVLRDCKRYCHFGNLQIYFFLSHNKHYILNHICEVIFLIPKFVCRKCAGSWLRVLANVFSNVFTKKPNHSAFIDLVDHRVSQSDAWVSSNGLNHAHFNHLLKVNWIVYVSLCWFLGCQALYTFPWDQYVGLVWDKGHTNIILKLHLSDWFRNCACAKQRLHHFRSTTW